MWSFTVSPVAECASPEPHRCLTRLCHQYAGSTSNTGPDSTLPGSVVTTAPQPTLPNSLSNSLPEYAVPSSLRTTAPEPALPCALSTTAPESSVLTLPCNSSGGFVTSIWGCPLKSTQITSPPEQPGQCQVILGLIIIIITVLYLFIVMINYGSLFVHVDC